MAVVFEDCAEEYVRYESHEAHKYVIDMHGCNQNLTF